MTISVSKSSIVPNIKGIDQKMLEYIDYERMNETKSVITFPKNKPSKEYVEYGDIMDDKYYKFIARFLSYQFKIPVKYLEPIEESCSYISQKSLLTGNDKNIRNAPITIEPLNSNWKKQVSYTPINQLTPLDTVVTINETIPWNHDDGTYPVRKLLTSASLVVLTDLESEIKKINPKTKYFGLCNRCIPYTAIDIGSEIAGKFIVKNAILRESMSIFRFRRPEDNILEIITPDYLNVDLKYVITEIMNLDKTKEFTDICSEIIRAIKA